MRVQVLHEERRCQDAGCLLDGVIKVKGKWWCSSHAQAAKAASAELVRLEVGRCPRCGSPTVREGIHEQPLLRHGGYGAARRTVTEHCASQSCHWWLTTDISEERPA